MKFKRKPIIVEAIQWFKLDDHKDVEEHGLSLVGAMCTCGTNYSLHGWLFSEKGGKVCPGDYIVTDSTGKVKRYKEDEFKENYDLFLG